MDSTIIIYILTVFTNLISGIVSYCVAKAKINREVKSDLYENGKEFRNELKEQITDLKSEIVELKKSNDTLENTVDDLRMQNMNLKLENAELQARIRNLINTIENNK